MAKVKRICKQCGKRFEVYPSTVKRGGGIFCSKECHNSAQQDEGNPQWKQKVKRICKQCGKEFSVIPSVAKKGDGIYCSKKCYHRWEQEHPIRAEKHPSWKGGKINRVCEECGGIFSINLAEVVKGNGRFCSQECYGKWRATDKECLNHLSRIGKIKRINKKPNKPESVFLKICKQNNLDFHYVGDGQLWIGKRKKLNPDFIEANGKKICIEIFGDYWHSPLLNHKMREGGTLEYRERHYKRFKWQPVFLWESDLKREDAEQFVLNTLQKEGII